jgi:hypothetical protein
MTEDTCRKSDAHDSILGLGVAMPISEVTRWFRSFAHRT